MRMNGWVDNFAFCVLSFAIAMHPPSAMHPYMRAWVSIMIHGVEQGMWGKPFAGRVGMVVSKAKQTE